MSLLCNNRSFPNPIQSPFDRPQKRIPPSISLRIRNQRLDANDEKSKKKLSDQSSWETKDSEGKDYLYRLGKESDNMNISVGARKGMIDDLFVGNFLGKDSDIVFDYRQKVTRSFEYLQGDYYIAPVFMDKIVCHIVKNYIAHLLNTKVPLILGIWGGKGQGKSFQTELIFQAMGIEPVIMSAGELESEKAGEPGRLIRERYRTASQVVQNQGKMSCLMVNDRDAGLGRFGNTQMTVNNQIVVGTLMNLCDNPTRVSIGQDWRESDITQRVPVIVTGNDFSTLYAPLIRDGRMEKFYWQPDREDIINIVHRMYEKDGITRAEVVSIVDTFPNQALDFYGALRSRTYDRSISKWINDIGGYENLGEKLLKARKDDKIPTFVPPKQKTCLADMALAPNNNVTVDPDSEFRGVVAAICQPAPQGDIHDVCSNHIAALTLSNEQGPTIQYREPHDDRDIVEAVYRWDERHYLEIFQTGFRPRPRDEHITSLQEYYNLERHVNGGGVPVDGAPADSVFVSTTRSTSWRPQVTADTILYRYEIFAPGGIDTVLTIPPDRHNYSNQQEIAFVGGISPQYIRSVRAYAVLVFPGLQFPVYAPFGDRVYRNGFFNPNPTSSNGGHTTDEFMERLRNVRCGPNMMINLVFRPQQHHIEKRDTEVDTTTPHHIEKRDTEVDTTTPLVKEEPYVDPIWSVGHYIECAFNFSNSKEAYLFIADRCLHVNYAPNNKIINGPMSIGYGFPYLRDTIFASGIDAAFTSSRENEAYIFRNNINALINFVYDGGRIIQGPKKITDSFYSLKGTIFEHGIDAAFASSRKNEAYIFKGDQYALINFAPGKTNDYIEIGPKKITDSFYSLKGTIFQDGFDAAFSSTATNEAYIFKGNTYALINYAPRSTDDFIIEGPTTPISDGFRSLKDIIPMYPRGL